MTKGQKYIKENLKEAFYIGEEGDMACFAKTELGAWRKFRARIREDCGNAELEEMERDAIGTAYWRLATPTEKEEYGQDCDFLVVYNEKTPYLCWVYSV